MTLDEARAIVDRYDRSFIEQEAFECLLAEIGRLEKVLAAEKAWRIDLMNQAVERRA